MLAVPMPDAWSRSTHFGWITDALNGISLDAESDATDVTKELRFVQSVCLLRLQSGSPRGCIPSNLKVADAKSRNRGEQEPCCQAHRVEEKYAECKASKTMIGKKAAQCEPTERRVVCKRP